MKKSLLLILMFVSNLVLAQKNHYKIEGVIKSKSDSTSIESATVHLEKVTDSTVITYSITDAKGSFSLEGKSFVEDAVIVVSYMGFKNFTKKLNLSKPPINLKTIFLDDTNILEEIVVKSRTPVTVKKDTLEFNVKSFKTKKDAKVEDLLKKLPGIEIDAEGKITVNGKPVNRLLVNGKSFFGDDPTIATQNLNKDLIQKIQITDTKSKTQAFTGESADGENKTINLTIKKDDNKGYFGDIRGGLGSNETNNYSTMINRFNNDRRISLSLNGRNQKTSEMNYFDNLNSNNNNYSASPQFLSETDRLLKGYTGKFKRNNYNASYVDKFSKEIDFNTDYFNSNTSNQSGNLSLRTTTLPDGSLFYSNRVSTSNAINHRQNVSSDLEFKANPTLLIHFEPRFTYSERESISNNFNESLNENLEATNNASTTRKSNSNNKNFNSRLSLSQKLNKKGSFLNLTAHTVFEDNNSDELFNSKIAIFDNITAVENRNQISNNHTTNNRVSISSKYRHSLTENLFFDFKVDYWWNRRALEKNTYDTDENQTMNFNFDLSSDFTYTNKHITPNLGFAFKNKKLDVTSSMSFKRQSIQNFDNLRPQLSLKRTFNAIESRNFFRYRHSSKTSFYGGYNVNNTPPQINQLQPFTDITDPLNIIVGNPSLKPTNNHSVYFGGNTFNFQKGISIYGYGSYNSKNNEVVRVSSIDENLVRTSTFKNVSGAYNIYGSLAFEKKIKLDSITDLKINLSTGFSDNRSINFFNDIEYTSNNKSINPRIRIIYSWLDVLRLEARYNPSFTKTKYNISNFENTHFSFHRFRIKSLVNITKRLEWESKIEYRNNPSVSDGFQKSFWDWDTEISYSLLNDRAQIKLEINDLLNQNNSVRRTATQNYIEDSQRLIMTRYFIIGFLWKFNTMGKNFKEPKRQRRYYNRRF